MSRHSLAAVALLLCLACDHATPLQPPPPPPPPPSRGPNHAPIAQISGPASGREGALTSFSARGSIDPDGDSLTYKWATGFGDTLSGPVGLSQQGWSYQHWGVYTPAVIVTDSHGAADTASMTITIVNTNPSISDIFTAATQAVGVTTFTRVAFSDSGRDDTHWLIVHWGDGGTDSTKSERMTRDSLRHAYATPGSYSVSATVRDDGGAADSAIAKDPVVVFNPGRQLIAGYEAIDLGSLGGNGVMPADINDRGQIVGFSLSSNGYPHAFLWQNGSMSDLGTLGHQGSYAQRINEAGEIVGVVWDTLSLSNFNPSGNCGCIEEPAIWINGEGRTLGGPERAMPGAVRIMANGDIAWNFWYYVTQAPYLWSNGDWAQLGSLHPPGANGIILDVNNRDQIVGESVVGYGGSIGLDAIPHPFLWDNGVMRDLGGLVFVPCADDATKDCSWGSAGAINDSGTIVGTSTANDGTSRFVIWTNGTIHDLGISGGNSRGVVINNRGQIALTRDGESFFWSDGKLRAIGSLGGATGVVGINDAGTVLGVGRLPTGAPHVFIWSQERGMVDLGSGPDGFDAAWPVAMNAAGDIIGFTSPSTLPCARDTFGGCEGSRAVLWRNTQPSASR